MIDSIARAFQEGGWGMWPTLFFGSVALALAVRHAVAPKKEMLPLIIGIGAATIFSGWLGMTVGIMTTLRYSKGFPPPEQTTMTMVGVSESLQNIALALVLAILISLATGVGSWRSRYSLSQ